MPLLISGGNYQHRAHKCSMHQSVFAATLLLPYMPSWNGQGQIYLFQSLFIFFLSWMHMKNRSVLYSDSPWSPSRLFSLNFLFLGTVWICFMYPCFQNIMILWVTKPCRLPLLLDSFTLYFTLYGTSSNEQPQLFFFTVNNFKIAIPHLFIY